MQTRNYAVLLALVLAASLVPSLVYAQDVEQIYAGAMVCLERLEKLAHTSIPAILAVSLVHEVIRNVMKKP